MTWFFTLQVAGLAAVLSVAGYLYARHLSDRFDRRYGHRPPAE